MDELEGLGFEAQALGLGFEEEDHGGVVWGRVGRVDTEVTLEARDGSVFLCFEEEFVLLGCCYCSWFTYNYIDLSKGCFGCAWF